MLIIHLVMLSHTHIYMIRASLSQTCTNMIPLYDAGKYLCSHVR
jgi:hypothetical protein